MLPTLLLFRPSPPQEAFHGHTGEGCPSTPSTPTFKHSTNIKCAWESLSHLGPYSITSVALFTVPNDFISLFTVYSLRKPTPRGQEFLSVSFNLCPRHPAQCLAHSRYSITTCQKEVRERMEGHSGQFCLTSHTKHRTWYLSNPRADRLYVNRTHDLRKQFK